MADLCPAQPKLNLKKSPTLSLSLSYGKNCLKGQSRQIIVSLMGQSHQIIASLMGQSRQIIASLMGLSRQISCSLMGPYYKVYPKITALLTGIGKIRGLLTYSPIAMDLWRNSTPFWHTSHFCSLKLRKLYIFSWNLILVKYQPSILKEPDSIDIWD